MLPKPRFLDGISGLAGTAFSAAQGIREEIHSVIKSRVEEAVYKLNLVPREEFEAVQNMASRARIAQEQAEEKLSLLEKRLENIEKELF